MSLEDLRNERLKKLKRLRDAGVNPYPPATRRTHTIAQALDSFDQLSTARTPISLAGRVIAQRGHGGLTFLDLDDGSGTVQALIGADHIGQGPYDFFLSVIDVGDFIEVSGVVLTTKRGERSIQGSAWGMLAKSVRPLPEKWHGLQDVEERYRQRAMDLLFNADVKEKFRRRFSIISSLRRFFEERRFAEVETPILQIVPGGATARPFTTHLNALDLDLHLRVAPELYLKRLLVGGLERVFEIGRNFRNEGMDREHNPEFTMLEAYAAYQDHEWLMELTEELIVRVVNEQFGKPSFTYQGKTIRVERPFKRLLFSDLVREASGLDYEKADAGELAERAKALGVTVEKTMTKAVLGDEIYKKTLRSSMMDPVFVVGHPLELSPLAKQISPESGTVARFQLIMGGFELTNGFSELNDAIDQMDRFRAQQDLREKGNEEAQRIDDDYVQALEYGMPPAAGIGIGVDRLVALLTDSHSLRDILLFPTMRPRD